MRMLTAALLTPWLAACGAGDPPSVEFDRPAATIYRALAGVDGRVDMQGLLTSTPVTRKQGADEELVFVLGHDGAKQRGRIVFLFEPLEGGRSRVSVDADIPEIEATIAGQRKVLSESKVEALLAERLAALSRRMSKGGIPTVEIDEIDQAIAFTAVALDPKQVNRALKLADDEGALNEAMQHEAAWSGNTLTDPAAGEIMDDAAGTDASGDDPSPDESWGVSSE